jgi:hypothetical protein
VSTVATGKASSATKSKPKKLRKSGESTSFTINKGSLKQAIIQTEVIRRPEDRW